MPFIDWSDPEEMMSLLLEYVQDERGESAGDAHRRRFLSGIVHDLQKLQTRFHRLPAKDQADALRKLVSQCDADFERDPVVGHLEECAGELERIGSEATTRSFPASPSRHG